MFTLEILDKYWLPGQPEETDLCLHGEVRVRIGDDVLEDEVCLSASAINLLRTLTEDRGLDPNAQALAGTGHFMLMVSENPPRVDISGAPYGIDWFVNHDGDDVIIQLKDGPEVTVPLAEYRAEVLRFCDEAEAFYEASKPKVLPEDKFVVDGYRTMWNEWHRRRGE